MDQTYDQDITIELIINGDSLPFAAISEQIGLQPSHIIHAGDSLPPTAIKAKKDTWRLSVKLNSDQSIEQGLSLFIDNLSSRDVAIADLSRRYEVGMVVYGSTYEQSVGLALDCATISKLSRLNILLDVDIYSFERKPLEEKSSQNKLVSILGKDLHIVKLLSGYSSAEVRKIVNALVAIELLAPSISENVSDILWDGFREDENDSGIEERLLAIQKDTTKLIGALDESEFLKGKKSADA